MVSTVVVIAAVAVGFVVVPTFLASLVGRAASLGTKATPSPERDRALASSMARHPSARAAASQLEASMSQRLLDGEVSQDTYRVAMELLAWESEQAATRR